MYSNIIHHPSPIPHPHFSSFARLPSHPGQDPGQLCMGGEGGAGGGGVVVDMSEWTGVVLGMIADRRLSTTRHTRHFVFCRRRSPHPPQRRRPSLPMSLFCHHDLTIHYSVHSIPILTPPADADTNNPRIPSIIHGKTPSVQ